VLSSDRLPKDIPSIEERLVSRFEWGMIADIQAPDFETRLAILKSKAVEKHYDIGVEVLNYIAETIQSNIRELEGALNRLMVYCQLNNANPTIDQAKTVLQGVASAKKRIVSVKKLMEVVADFYNISLDDLLRQSRRKEFVKPRQIAMYLMREELENSFPSIGEHFGGRDHTTVMHAVDKINKLLAEKESMKQEIDLIVNKLYM
jgi:chromosomal replication initiator protein